MAAWAACLLRLFQAPTPSLQTVGMHDAYSAVAI
jgi:hypothetical protein